MATHTQIPSWTIPALVIAFNHVQFIDSDLVVGRVIDIPCKNDNIYDNEDMWAIPVKDNGIFTQFDFQLKTGDYLAQPSFDSFTVFRLRDKNYNEWIVLGTKNDFFTSCATCCDKDGVPMVGLDGSFSDRIAPCQTVDIVNGSNVPYAIFSLPTLGVGEAYFPYGSIDNVALTTASSEGYNDVTALLAFLNGTAGWDVATWTEVGGIVYATGVTTGSNVCVNIVAVIPSP